jgi:hypothetical protein
MGMSRPDAGSKSSTSNVLVRYLRASSSALIMITRDLTHGPDPAQAGQETKAFGFEHVRKKNEGMNQ